MSVVRNKKQALKQRLWRAHSVSVVNPSCLQSKIRRDTNPRIWQKHTCIKIIYAIKLNVYVIFYVFFYDSAYRDKRNE